MNADEDKILEFDMIPIGADLPVSVGIILKRMVFPLLMGSTCLVCAPIKEEAETRTVMNR